MKASFSIQDEELFKWAKTNAPNGNLSALITRGLNKLRQEEISISNGDGIPSIDIKLTHAGDIPRTCVKCTLTPTDFIVKRIGDSMAVAHFYCEKHITQAIYATLEGKE